MAVFTAALESAARSEIVAKTINKTQLPSLNCIWGDRIYTRATISPGIIAEGIAEVEVDTSIEMPAELNLSRK